MLMKSDSDRHIDEFRNLVCAPTEPGCTVERTKEALARNSAPCFANIFGGSCSQSAVENGSKQYAAPVGDVTTYRSPNGTITNITGPRHLLSGAVIREVVSREDGIYIYTSSTGKGGAFVHYRGAASIGWDLSARAIRNAVVDTAPAR